jgi:hypothetical protein
MSKKPVEESKAKAKPDSFTMKYHQFNNELQKKLESEKPWKPRPRQPNQHQKRGA